MEGSLGGPLRMIGHGVDQRTRHLRYLAQEIVGRENLAAQQFPLSPSSPLSVLVVSRENNLTPPLVPWVGAHAGKNTPEQNTQKT